MARLTFENLPEVFVSDVQHAPFISREVKRGRIRKLASRLYTTNLKEPAERLVQRHLWSIVAAFYPGALIADRTALENKPAADGSLFLVSDKKAILKLPSVTLRPRKGTPPLASDRPFIQGLFLSSLARAFLENCIPSRARKGIARTLSRAELEERLENLFQRGGEQALNRLRDEMCEIAPALSLEKEYQLLHALIGALLGTREVKLSAPVAIARAKGFPYDQARLDLFQQLRDFLVLHAPHIRPAGQGNGLENLAFFEAYFSNFIEGTEFEVEEAHEIIFEGKIPRARPEDAHDILGTYLLVSDLKEMQILPQTAEGLFQLLARRHRTIMEGRPEKLPGQFKTVGNRAGNTVFVAPELVKGTLQHGLEIYKTLQEPFHRALFMMFLIAEVHPFADGNGRVARVMMNAELCAASEMRVIIPIIFRSNYLVALKTLSQSGRTSPLLRTLDFAQQYTARVDWSSYSRSYKMLQRTHAFMDPQVADLEGVRLILP